MLISMLGCSGPSTADKAGSAPPPSSIAWGTSSAGLRLGLEADGVNVTFTLENVSDKRLEVLSHVATHEKHLDWFTLRLTHEGPQRELRFIDDRNRSAPIKAALEPGGRLSHRMDVAAWAARAANGGRPLDPGMHAASAVYEVSDSSVWSGRIESGEVSIAVPAK